MNINNNFNNYDVSFNKAEKRKQKMFNMNEAMTVLINACKDGLYNAAERKVPENGIFDKVSVAFGVPTTNNNGLLYIIHSGENPKTQRVLYVGVHHKNSDRMTSNILSKGTKKEILSYLKSKENTQEIIDVVTDLSAKTDEYYSSL